MPDFMLRRQDGSVLVVDVKPVDFLDVAEIAAVLAWTGRACRTRGWAYEVWSGAEPTVLANVRYLGRARRPGPVPAEAVSWLSRIDPRGRSWDEVVWRCAVRPTARGDQPGVCALLGRGVWHSDLSQPLHGDSRLHMKAVW